MVKLVRSSKLFHSRPNVPLRVVLVVPFVLQVVAAVGLTGYFAFQNGKRMIETVADQLMDEVSDRINQNLENNLGTPVQISHDNATAVRLGILKWQDPATMERYFLEQIQTADGTQGEIKFIGVISQKKNFVAVSKVDDDSWIVRSRTSPTDPQSTSPPVNVFEVNGRGERTQPIDNASLKLNRAFEQDWLQLANSPEKGIWRFAVNCSNPSQPALMAVYLQPFYDANKMVQGVSTAAINLSILNTSLENLSIGRTGQAFVVDRHGLLIATSTGEQPFLKRSSRSDPTDPNQQRLPAVRSWNSVTNQSAQQLLDIFGSFEQVKAGQQHLIINGKPYFVQVAPFQSKQSLNWLTVVLIPEADFATDIHRNYNHMLLLCLAALAGAIALGILTAQQVTKPIEHLSNASRDLTLGRLETPIAESSYITELEVLAHTFNDMTEHLQWSFDEVQRALQESEEKFTKVFRTSPDPIFLVTLAEGRFLEVNDSFLKHIEYSKTETLHHTSLELGVWESQAERDRFVAELRKSGKASENERSFTTRTGKPITLLFSSEIIELDGQACVLTVAKDITERKQLEQALQKSEAMLADVLNSAVTSICFFYLNLKGELQYIYFSPSNQAIFGYTPEELRADTELWKSRVHPSDRDLAFGIALPSSAYGSHTTEYRFYHKDGSLRWISDHITYRWNESRQSWMITTVAIDITDRKQAEAALRHSEANLREAQRVAHIGSWEYDPINQTTFCSEELFQIQGRDSVHQPLSLADSFKAIHPNDLAAHHLLIAHAIQTGKPYEQTLRILRSDGSIRYGEVRGEPIFNGAGQLIRLVGTVLDITERQLTNQTLRHREQQLRQMTDALPAYIAYIDTDQRYQFVNKLYERQFGQRREEFYGKHIRDVLNADGYQVLQSHLEFALQGQSNSYIMEQPDAQGKIRYLEVTLVPDWGEDDQVRGCFSLVIDITVRKQAEAAIHHRESLFRAAFDSAAIGMSITALDGGFIQVNQALCRMHGYTEAELLSMQFQDLTHPDDLTENLILLGKALAGETNFYQMEKRYIHKNGSIVWGVLRTTLIRDAQQQPLYFVSHIQDITVLKQAELKLHQEEYGQEGYGKYLNGDRPMTDSSPIRPSL